MQKIIIAIRSGSIHSIYADECPAELKIQIADLGFSGMSTTVNKQLLKEWQELKKGLTRIY